MKKERALCYPSSMLFITGLDFTKRIPLFDHLQNRGEELLVTAGRKIMRSFRSPFVLFVTCDRAEIISLCEFPREILERALSVSSIAAADCRYSLCGDDAMLHVFLLASGVLSPLFGEDTVQGQIADGAESARLIGSSCPEIDKLLNMAAAFSKRVHTDMKVRVFDRTIAEEVARRVASCARILIVGSGEGARIVAETLIPGHEVLMTLRDADKTFLVPFGAKPIAYDERLKAAAASDAVISITSGLYHTFSEGDAWALGGKLLFDLSSPPDIPASLGAISVEDLGVGLPEKDEVIRRVRALAGKEAREYEAWLERSEAAPDVQARAEAIAYESIRRLSGPLSRLGEEEGKAFREALFDSVRKAVVSCEMDARKS